MIEEEDRLPLSALQHLAYCRRQCALIHIEGYWSENRQTASGRILHRRVHDAATRMESGIIIARSLRLTSGRLGLVGIADVVEFHPDPSGIRIPGHKGMWMPFPVEYKRGRPKQHQADEIQLCAQALCLEEMLHAAIPAGALFYGKTRRRQPVDLNIQLRSTVESLCSELHQLIASKIVPQPEPGPKCRLCSLLDECAPGENRAASAYIDRILCTLCEDAYEDM
jgi:CRISPR-associated exonuclease Cas4